MQKNKLKKTMTQYFSYLSLKCTFIDKDFDDNFYFQIGVTKLKTTLKTQ